MQTQAHGWLVLDKPAGISSRAAVDRAARWFPHSTRIGHTGTLDPFATGVLVLCIGVATRLAECVQEMMKTYRARFRLGARSETDDVEGPIHSVANVIPPDMTTLDMACAEFVGSINQVPPAFSAVKVGGKRAYDLARRGAEVKLKARPVTIARIDILAYEFPLLELEVRCGEGTYIRSLARDLGERLGCGAYVETLRRVSVGGFDIANAVTLDCDAPSAVARLLPVKAAVAHWYPCWLDAHLLDRLRHGQSIPAEELAAQSPWEYYPRVAVFNGDVLAALAEYESAKKQLRPLKVLAY
jgi:tRNA pseudouridine55 synthase